ncbi:exonuclease [Pukyongiella litopenaei]|uniref:Exonuclease n=1 Tax=Pukyongiella litopenaei TaxID=2605946 RepID=A0A2S0MNK0_9RHOB|nr:exonuclease [Pukyongiella litopenaei]AVO37472.1 exonuclease [Pukyongiella litopenaei]
MRSITVYDAEFLTAPGAPQRFWCGPEDPDPLTIQIGAVRLSLEPPFGMSQPESWPVRPVDRHGRVVPVDPLVTRLTGLGDADLARGLPLTDALRALDRFSQGDPLFAWGKDELLTLAASLFVEQVPSPIPATRFRSAVPLLVRAGETRETVEGLRSHTICAHFGLASPGRAHDAAGDAQAVATVLGHLLGAGRLRPGDFAGPAPA